jgi:hypothetical protein
MSDFRQRFDPSEISEANPSSVDLIDVARDLEAYADVGLSGPTATFEERVMAAIAVEPAPRLLSLGPISTLRQAWQLAWSGGRPLAVRARALALVLVAAVAIGAVGSLGVVAASRLVSPDVPPPPTTQPSPSPSPPPSPSPSPSVSPSPSPSVSPTPTPTRTPRSSPTETIEPRGTDDHGGGSGSGTSGPGAVPTAARAVIAPVQAREAASPLNRS